MFSPLDALRGLHPMFTPQWEQPTEMPTVRVLDQTLDATNPMWAKALDAYGASDPGGAHLGGNMGAAMSGLKQASPEKRRLNLKYAKEAEAHANAVAPGL